MINISVSLIKTDAMIHKKEHFSEKLQRKMIIKEGKKSLDS